MALEDVKRYYAAFDEWERLERPAGRLEFARNMTYLDRFLPEPCRVLDLGCGPGRYAIALAKRGHTVMLADLSATQLEVAKAKVAEAGVEGQVEGFRELNATNLGELETEAFDAIVAFGPFYHLISRDARERAAKEMARVLRPGGWLFAAFIPPPFHLSHLIERAVSRPEQVCKENFTECWEEGLFLNRHEDGFQEAHFAYPAEITETLANAGLTCELVASLRGIANHFEEDLFQIAERDAELFEAIMDVVDRSSTHPSVIDMAGHAIAVARKPGPHT